MRRPQERFYWAVGFILIISLSPMFVQGTSSPTINRVVTSGAIGPCTWFVSLDGTTPVAEAMVGGLSVNVGDNVVGTAGQDIGGFLASVIAPQQKICLSAQTFTTNARVVSGGFYEGISLKDGDALIGSGIGSTIIKLANGQFPGTNGEAVIGNYNWGLAAFQPNYNITVSDLTVDMNKAGQTAPTADAEVGIALVSTVRVSIERVEVKNFYTWGVTIGSAESASGVGLPINDRLGPLWIHDGGNGNVPLYDSGVFITGHHLNNGVVADSYIYNVNGYGIALEDLPGGVIVRNNHIFKVQGDGIRGFLSSTPGSGIDQPNSTEILGNTIASVGGITNLGYGININPAGSGMVIAENTIRNATNRGIFVQANNIPAIGVSISNNIVSNTGTSNPNNYAGIQIMGTSASSTLQKVAVVGNVVFDNQASKTQAFGLDIFNGQINGLTVIGNDFTGNLQTGINFGTQTTLSNIIIRDNQGTNPFGKITNWNSNNATVAPWGTTSIVKASTTYTVGGVDDLFTSTGGTGVSINVGCGGNNYISAAATLTNQLVWVGCTINFGAFSVAPTVTVFGN